MPKFTKTSCSQCGREFGPGDEGFSHCHQHSHLDAAKPLARAAAERQATRMLKCECLDCGYIVRVTRKWIDAVGAPHCPRHGEMIVGGV
ncbi:hypothetical protein RA307_04905 [Xanthobacteraceae bacterium Astr-EGSB]|uniref:hypothetical protein n=1 Tax=Astrobacterium formosum TaxID=3069710 RepID=UPI0027AF6D55|nr:hypothetical protein [Xanthobacteraceae bacterium Astr-EGSB]